MSVAVFEGVIEGGRIRLIEEVRLPDHARVYVVVPEVAEPVARVASPRLARREQAADFKLEVVEGGESGSL
jgi:hypothetical protein